MQAEVDSSPRETSSRMVSPVSTGRSTSSTAAHLDELRWRLIYALCGFAVAVGVCAYFTNDIVAMFCRPLVNALAERNLNPQLCFSAVGDALSIWFRITAVSAVVLASPWIIYQFWLFVAAGLYTHERYLVYRLVPTSILLMIAGVIFAFLVVLPASLGFLLDVGSDFPSILSGGSAHVDADAASSPSITPISGDPENLQPFCFWFDTRHRQLKVSIPSREDPSKGEMVILPFTSGNLAVPLITLDSYVDMVLMWLAIFGASFQLPLIEMGLVRVGILTVEQLKRARRFAYLGLTVLAALIMPDVLSGTLALLLPLCILYELGILLATRRPISRCST